MIDELATERVFLMDGAEENGLATLMCALINENLSMDSRKLASFARLGLRVGVVATDTDVCLTLVFQFGLCEIHDGLLQDCALVIEAPAGAIASISRAPRVAGLPDPRTHAGRQLMRTLLGGRVRVRRLHRHPLALWRLSQILSAAG